MFRATGSLRSPPTSARILRHEPAVLDEELCAITAELLYAARSGRTSTSVRSSSRAATASACGAAASTTASSSSTCPWASTSATAASDAASVPGGGQTATPRPARAKIGGVYASMALARRDAMEGGFDEAITLTADGRVAEGTAENIFLVIDGALVTPIARRRPAGRHHTRERHRAGDVRSSDCRSSSASVNRSELYVADELFLCGTAAEVTPVAEIDRRRGRRGVVGP